MKKKIIVAMCGASGIQYGIEVLRALKEADIQTYLVLSNWAERLIQEETPLDIQTVKNLASHVFQNDDMAAPISSSSFQVDSMVVIPATVKTVSEIANAHCTTLIARAADNILKMQKRFVVCIRETPLSGICLENLSKIAHYGGIILPLSPGFYHKPTTINDLYDFITGKVLDCLEIKNTKYKRWKEDNNGI